jgi:predicted ribosomally synthesized peptide with SipW-like signal peptide
MPNEFDISRRKALAALGTIGAASAGAGLGTSAYFSDRETFENNRLVAGTLDVGVSYSAHYSDWSSDEAEGVPNVRMWNGEAGTTGDADDLGPDEVGLPSNAAWLVAVSDDDDGDSPNPDLDVAERFLDNTQYRSYNDSTLDCVDGAANSQADDEERPVVGLDDVKPGDFGEVTFDFILCDNPGFVSLTGGVRSAAENGLTEPEATDDQEDGDADSTDPADVELLDAVQAACWVDDGNNLQNGDEDPATGSLREVLSALSSGTGVPLAGDVPAEEGGGSGRNCFSADTEHSVAFAWWLPVDHANQIQGDSVAFDLGIYAEQCRHNDGDGTTATAYPRTQRAKLTAADGDKNDRFGHVALADDGDTALVGAVFDEDPNGNDAGSAYVLERSGGSWSQQAKLAPADGDPEDTFGSSVALAGDGATALVGADRDEDPAGTASGSAYVFVRSGGTWSQQAKLTAADGDSGDVFGTSVALADGGDTALLGAQGDEDPHPGGLVGSAYVFVRSGGTWSQQAKLAASDGDSADFFGTSVALADSGDTALVGANGVEVGSNGASAGAAYVFGRSGGSWGQQAKLIAADAEGADTLGDSVALADDGEIALAGASGDGAGSAYVFGRSGGSWSQQAKLSATAGGLGFGESVAMNDDGTVALFGASFESDPNGFRAGAAYVFVRSGKGWRQRAKLVAADGDPVDDFGQEVALADDGRTALLGAPGDDNPNGEDAGSAYVFGP